MTTRKKILIALASVFIAVVFALGVLFLAAAVLGWRTAERSANEAATIQNHYFIIHDRKYATIDELVREQMLSAKFAAQPAIADGYMLTLELTQPIAYKLTADPLDQSSGKRHFYLDSASMRIHANPGGPAGPNDPPLESK